MTTPEVSAAIIKTCSFFMRDFSRQLPSRSTSPRSPFSSSLTIVASGLGIYALFAIAYHYFVTPAIRSVVPQGMESRAAPAPAPAQQPSSKPLRFVSTGAAEASAESSAAAEPRNEAKRTVERRERPRRYRPSGQFPVRPFSGFHPWF